MLRMLGTHEAMLELASTLQIEATDKKPCERLLQWLVTRCANAAWPAS